MPVKFVIGVKKFPFASHAWLEWNDKEKRGIILQNEDEIRDYKVIIDSSKYIRG